ncbi:MAG TPA: hypothetical protein VK324_12950 [Tepidisphaeraceae bacterium]|nr:hypothetical protein [Tepidisphaeraceae bacterium]
MKEVVYRQIDEHGNPVQMHRGTVADLLWAMPSFPAALAANNGVPPLAKLNVMLALTKDTDVTGAGIAWVPFQLDGDEYLSLAEQLAADPRVPKNAIASPAPADVIDPLDLALGGLS